MSINCCLSNNGIVCELIILPSSKLRGKSRNFCSLPFPFRLELSAVSDQSPDETDKKSVLVRMVTKQIFENVFASRMVVQQAKNFNANTKCHFREKAKVDQRQQLRAQRPCARKKCFGSRICFFSDNDVLKLT